LKEALKRNSKSTGRHWDLLSSASGYEESTGSGRLKVFEKWRKMTKEALANLAQTDPEAFQRYQNSAGEIEQEFDSVRRWLAIIF
jgi:hypothetical protein